MKKISNLITVLLSIVNILGSIIIMFLILRATKLLFIFRSNLSTRKLALTKNKMHKINNKLYMNEYEYPPKKLRKLVMSTERPIIAVFSLISFFFSFVLIFSFCYKDNKFSNGRNKARYVGIIGEIILNFIIVVSSSIFIYNNNYNIENLNYGKQYLFDSVLICIISCLLVIFNFLGVLLPNLNKTNTHTENEEFKKPLTANIEPTTLDPDIELSPIDKTPKENKIGYNYQPIDYTPNEPAYKPTDDLNKSQDNVYDAPPSIQGYPRPEFENELPSKQDIFSNEITKEQ